MFSKTSSDFSKLVECSFIVGIPYERIKEYNESDILYPQCLCCIPLDQKNSIDEGMLEFVFPEGVKVSYSEESPKFYSVALTNEKGIRSYIYILKLLEKVEVACRKLEKKVFKPEIRVPFAICIQSKILDTDSFKEILHEAYDIINYEDSRENDDGAGFHNLEVFNYKRVELLNYFLFLTSILKPPPHTLMRLNLRFSSVDLYFSSCYEIPCTLNDNNIRILFSCLEISIVIKLWFSILTEKNIIIIAHQSYLLFSICEALLKLIFPFKWLHTFIPVLPASQIEYLEAPTPYIIGMLSSSADLQTLEESFPNHVICDVDSCQISENTAGCNYLPHLEETNLRKKLQIVKNPEIFEIEEITSQVGKKVAAEDVNSEFTFSSNIQRIFLRIIRNCMEGYKKNYLTVDKKGGKKKVSFNDSAFLESLTGDEYKNVWKIIIKTIAFENFILFNQYKDDSNTRIFNNIVKHLSEEFRKNQKNSHKIELTLPKTHIRELLTEMNDMKIEDKEMEKMLKDYLTVLNIPEKQQNLNLPMRSSYQDNNDVIIITSNPTINKIDIIAGQDSQNVLRRSLMHKSITFRTSNMQTKRLNTPFCFYDNKKSFENVSIFENGFISFANNAMKMFDVYGIPFITRLKNDLILEICDLLGTETLKSFLNCKNGERSTDEALLLSFNEQILEEKEENEADELESRPSPMKLYIGKLNYDAPCEENQQEKIFHYDENLRNSAQYFLLIAFYLEELKQSSGLLRNFTIDIEKLTEQILIAYHSAFATDRKEFPLFRYHQFIDSFDLKKLNQVKTYQIDKKLKAIIQDKINSMSKKYSSLFINTSFKDEIQKSANMTMTPKEILTKKSHFRRCSTYTEEVQYYKQSLAATPMTPTSQASYSISSGDESTFTRVMRRGKAATISSQNPTNMKYLVAMRNQMKEEIKQHELIKKTLSYGKNIANTIVSVSEENKTIEAKEVQKSSKVLSCFNITKGMDGYKVNNGCGGIIKKKSIKSNRKESLFTKPQVFNTSKKIYKRSDPIAVISEIGKKLMAIIENFELSTTNILFEKTLNEIEDSSEMRDIKNLVACFQKVNLSKFANSMEKLAFWLNCFNSFVLVVILFHKCVFSTNQDWSQFLQNTLFNMGGYDISLYEIHSLIIGGHNFFREEIAFHNDLLSKFIICEADKQLLLPLINFGISFPISSFPQYRLYTSDGIYEELKENAAKYFNSKILYNTQSESLTISEYLKFLDPKFLKEGYKHYQSLLPEHLYDILASKRFKSVDVIKISWNISFSDVI